MPTPVSIAVVNDFDLATADTCRLLAPFAERVRVAQVVTDGPVTDPVDVAVYDTFGRPSLGLDRLEALVADPAVGKVVVHTAGLSETAMQAIWGVGVSGCLAKSLTASDVVRGIERVANGDRVVAMRGAGGPTNFRAGDLPLSYREAEVLVLLSQGLRNRTIAEALDVGEETVKSHLKSIYRKLGVKTRGEAIASAYASSFLSRPTAPVGVGVA